ncbi:hypothetical protein ACO0LC_06425 [Undibacterium sp. JH2W]|uniref:hypothetical protein n=1 Tax=Undibacterium sp. JH2W TaxID=3413037 RepID=UPI003BF3007F
MDYYQSAFGKFNPQGDPHVAVKFILNILVSEERFSDLLCLLTDGNQIGALEGVPGWIIERRRINASGAIDYFSEWPKDAKFHAYVDPSEFELASPSMFMNEDTFHGFVRLAINAYSEKNTSKSDYVEKVSNLLH